jgi:hypothetical protein
MSSGKIGGTSRLKEEVLQREERSATRRVHVHEKKAHLRLDVAMNDVLCS